MTAEPARRRSRMPIAVAIVLVIGIVVAVAVANGAFGGATATATPGPSAPGVVPADAAVVAEGRAVPVRWAELTPAVAGRVASIPVAVGDTVTQGQTVLELDRARADLEVESATVAATAAAAATARAEAAVTQAQANADAAGASVTQAQAAKRVAAAARDALPSFASKAQERQAKAQVEQADAAIDVARAQRRGALASVTSARAALDAAKADESRAGVAVKVAEEARDNLVVTAPVGGTVISIDPAVGDLVQPGAVVVRIADPAGWRFETTDLSETSVGRVSVGAPATVTVDGFPGQEIAGTVESVGGYGASSQGDIVFKVVVVPTGAVPDGLRWNMTSTMEIEGSTGS